MVAASLTSILQALRATSCAFIGPAKWMLSIQKFRNYTDLFYYNLGVCGKHGRGISTDKKRRSTIFPGLRELAHFKLFLMTPAVFVDAAGG